MSDEQVVSIASIPLSARLQAPLPDGFEGTLSYSQHELGVQAIHLETPIEFVPGDPESEARAEQAIVRAIRVVSAAVITGFADQLDAIHGLMASRRGYRPSPPDVPDEL